MAYRSPSDALARIQDVRDSSTRAPQPYTNPALLPKPEAPQQPTADAYGGGGGDDLVDFNGYRYASGVVPYLQTVLKEFPGLHLTSGYRDPEHNARSGGVPNSYHLRGYAADLVGDPKMMYSALARARQLGAIEALVHNAGSGNHLHIAFRPQAQTLPYRGAPSPATNLGGDWRRTLTPAEAWIIQRESSFNPTARNSSTGAFGIWQGNPSSGTLQSIARQVGVNPYTTNPWDQLAMFRLYVRQRYGTPENAQRFWSQHGWY